MSSGAPEISELETLSPSSTALPTVHTLQEQCSTKIAELIALGYSRTGIAFNEDLDACGTNKIALQSLLASLRNAIDYIENDALFST